MQQLTASHHKKKQRETQLGGEGVTSDIKSSKVVQTPSENYFEEEALNKEFQERIIMEKLETLAKKPNRDKFLRHLQTTMPLVF